MPSHGKNSRNCCQLAKSVKDPSKHIQYQQGPLKVRLVQLLHPQQPPFTFQVLQQTMMCVQSQNNTLDRGNKAKESPHWD